MVSTKIKTCMWNQSSASNLNATYCKNSKGLRLVHSQFTTNTVEHMDLCIQSMDEQSSYQTAINGTVLNQSNSTANNNLSQQSYRTWLTDCHQQNRVKCNIFYSKHRTLWTPSHTYAQTKTQTNIATIGYIKHTLNKWSSLWTRPWFVIKYPHL